MTTGNDELTVNCTALLKNKGLKNSIIIRAKIVNC